MKKTPIKENCCFLGGAIVESVYPHNFESTSPVVEKIFDRRHQSGTVVGCVVLPPFGHF